MPLPYLALVKPARVDYVYHGDLTKMLGSAVDTSALGQLYDDLVLVAQRTGVHLPMSVDAREGIGDSEIGHSTRVTHYRYAFVPNPEDPGESSVQIKGVYGPAQIDAFVRDDWGIVGQSGLSLWQRGFQLMPDWAAGALYHDAAALALATMNDTELIEPLRGAGQGAGPLKVWQAADRWTTYHGHARTVPPSGDGSIGSSEPSHLGRPRSEFSRPGIGGPTLRRDFSYATEAEDLEDSVLVKRKCQTWPSNQQSVFSLVHGYRLRGSVQQVREWTRTTSDPAPTDDPWSGESWVLRRRTTTRSEERELFAFAYQYSKADGTALGLKSLVSAVPFTVAELIEDLDPDTGERRRSWLTVHEFDEYNRPSRTLDPGAFTAEYPPEDAPLAQVVKLRLLNWKTFVAEHSDASHRGSIQSTTYQDQVGPTAAFSNLLRKGGPIDVAGASTHYEMNYPSTLRAQKKFVGNTTGGSLVEYQVHPGDLKYFGGFKNGNEVFGRPDLIDAVHRSRTGEDVSPIQADQFESVNFGYTLKNRANELGYPALTMVSRAIEREPESENGPPSSGAVTTSSYLDILGRERFRVGPDGVAVAFEYGVHGPDLNGRAERVHQHVTLTDANGDGAPDTFEAISWDSGVGTLAVSALYDVSGHLLRSVDADGVESTRAYEIRAYVDPFNEMLPPIPTVSVASFPPLAGPGERAGPISVSYVDSAGRAFRSSSFAPANIAANEDGIVTGWTLGQEVSRRQTGYYLSGAVEQEQSYPFASVGGVFPGAIPIQENDRSAPVVAYCVYDGDASPIWSMDAAGNTEKIEYDARSRPIRAYLGVDGVPEQLVESRFYDGEDSDRLGIGNGLLTRVESYIGSDQSSQHTRISRLWYDNRDRLSLQGQLYPNGSAVTPYSVSVLDNLDRPVLTASFSAAVVPPEGTRFGIGEQELIQDTSAVNLRRTRFSQRGEVYREESLIGRDGQPQWQRTDHWLDSAGRELATTSFGAASVKHQFDPHGRVARQLTSAGTPTTFADATNPAKGFVLEETITDYLPQKTLPARVTLRQRTHTSVPTSGTLADEPIGADPLKGVTTYSATAYDSAARPVAAINYGTFAGPTVEGFTSVSVSAAPPIVPFGQGTSVNAPLPTVLGDNAIVTRTGYDSRGRASVVSRWLEIDNAGVPTKQEATRTLSDSLGRVYATIENDSNPAGASPVSVTWTAQGGGRWSASGMSQPASDQNRVTTKVYDNAGLVVKHIAHQRATSGGEGVQVTAFRYQWDQALDAASSLLASNSFLHEIRYPATSGASIGEASTNPIDRVHYSYNALGEQIAVQDQNGTIRDFMRDNAGRMIADRVRVFGATAASPGDSHQAASVDRAVSQIITKHDDFGRVAGVVSCFHPAGEEYDPALNLDPNLSLSLLLQSDLVHNFVTYQYDGLLGQVTSFRQSSDGKLPAEGSGPNYREVGITYERMSGAAGASWRTAKVKHPDSTFSDSSDDTGLVFNYEGHPVDAAINRAWGLSLSNGASAQELVRYARLGASTIAVTDFRQIGVQLDRSVAADLTRDYDPSGGSVEHSRYGGWDRYGRLLRNSWVRSDFGVGGRKPIWQELYAHDALSRRTSRDESRGNYGYLDEDWRVTYDGLDRVTKTERGRTGVDGVLVLPTTGLPVKQWTLDELGNWTGVLSTRPGLTPPPSVEVRPHNAANEIKAIGNLARSYDANGNLLLVRPSAPSSAVDRQRYVVDAWNRVVKVEWLKTPLPTPIYDTLEYSYNGLNHLVLEKRTPGEAAAPGRVHRFYSPTWQLLLERHETFDGTTWQPGAIERQFFGLRGLDDAILRRVDANGDGDYADGGDVSYHQLTDASFSVIAHVDLDTGLVRQWMSYDAFGVMRVLRGGDFDGDGAVNVGDWTEFNAAFNDPALAPCTCDIDADGTVTGNDYDLFGQLWEETSDQAYHDDEVRLGYAGYMRDPFTGLLLARNRWYDPSVGRWITRDPAGYSRPGCWWTLQVRTRITRRQRKRGTSKPASGGKVFPMPFIPAAHRHNLQVRQCLHGRIVRDEPPRLDAGQRQPVFKVSRTPAVTHKPAREIVNVFGESVADRSVPRPVDRPEPTKFDAQVKVFARREGVRGIEPATGAEGRRAYPRVRGHDCLRPIHIHWRIQDAFHGHVVIDRCGRGGHGNTMHGTGEGNAIEPGRRSGIDKSREEVWFTPAAGVGEVEPVNRYTRAVVRASVPGDGRATVAFIGNQNDPVAADPPGRVHLVVVVNHHNLNGPWDARQQGFDRLSGGIPIAERRDDCAGAGRIQRRGSHAQYGLDRDGKRPSPSHVVNPSDAEPFFSGRPQQTTHGLRPDAQGYYLRWCYEVVSRSDAGERGEHRQAWVHRPERRQVRRCGRLVCRSLPDRAFHVRGRRR
ncbi:MAG: hypothetical protein IT434_16840 [Phycisphaerales bacterium]|nr:hypothetical protein [Phycisphaerales bacterium]